MIKLYSAIQGKKMSLLGEGETLIEAVKNADLECNYPELDTLEEVTEYIATSHSDYVIVDTNYELLKGGK